MIRSRRRPLILTASFLFYGSGKRKRNTQHRTQSLVLFLFSDKTTFDLLAENQTRHEIKIAILVGRTEDIEN